VTPIVLVAVGDEDAGLLDEDQPPATEEKAAPPKSSQDDQLNKALEILKNRETKG
jgi:hypothetical protein